MATAIGSCGNFGTRIGRDDTIGQGFGLDGAPGSGRQDAPTLPEYHSDGHAEHGALRQCHLAGTPQRQLGHPHQGFSST
jgi:hypothetical protein